MMENTLVVGGVERTQSIISLPRSISAERCSQPRASRRQRPATASRWTVRELRRDRSRRDRVNWLLRGRARAVSTPARHRHRPGQPAARTHSTRVGQSDPIDAELAARLFQAGKARRPEADRWDRGIDPSAARRARQRRESPQRRARADPRPAHLRSTSPRSALSPQTLRGRSPSALDFVDLVAISDPLPGQLVLAPLYRSTDRGSLSRNRRPASRTRATRRGSAPRTIQLLYISTARRQPLTRRRTSRLRGHGSSSMLCGASPIPASSGKRPSPPQHAATAKPTGASPHRRTPAALLPTHARIVKRRTAEETSADSAASTTSPARSQHATDDSHHAAEITPSSARQHDHRNHDFRRPAWLSPSPATRAASTAASAERTACPGVTTRKVSPQLIWSLRIAPAPDGETVCCRGAKRREQQVCMSRFVVRRRSPDSGCCRSRAMDVDSRCARCGDRRVGRTDAGAACRGG